MLTRSQSSRLSRRVSTPRSREISPISPHQEEGQEPEVETPGPSTAEKGKGRPIIPQEADLTPTLPQPPQMQSTDALLLLVQQLGEQAARDREQAALDRRTLHDAFMA